MKQDNSAPVVIAEVDAITNPEVVTTYVDPDAVFNELPVVTRDFITDLCKDKFSKEIMAVGTLTESKIAAFRNAWLVDAVSAAHKQLVKLQAARSETRARELYLELRSRGIAIEAASKASGYNPLT